MIRCDLIIEHIESVLNTDTQLRTLLNALPSQSKVFIRNSEPEQPQYPFILLSDCLLQPALIGQRHNDRVATIAFDLTIYSKLKANGEIDYEQMYTIATRANAILSDLVIAVTAGIHCGGITLVQAQAAQTGISAAFKVLNYNAQARSV